MNKQLLLLGVAALCLALGACSGDDGDEKTECKTAADCATGEICVDGTCKPDETPACDPACTGATPICDEASGSCKTCTADEGCSGGTPICDTTANDGKGACVACRSTDDCTAPSVCDTDTHTCVGCTETEGCSGDTPVCDDGTCVACTATAGCDTGKICDTSVAGGVCVTCLADGSGCESGQLCDTSVAGGTCVNCFADGTGCPASAPACDTSVPGGTCVQCTTNQHCSGSVDTRLCDTARNVCVTCNDANDGCQEPWPYCDVSANEGKGRCVDCLSDDQCGETYPHCNVEDNRCRTCVTDDHCPDKENAPYCDPQYPGKCKACVDNSHCGGDTPVCDPDANNGLGACVTCKTGQGCAAPLFCDVHVPGGQCVACTDTAGCPSTKVCDRSEGPGVCVFCLEDGTGCEENQYCDTSVEGHACSTCLPDGTGCEGGLICDTSVAGGACVTCLADGTGCDAGESCVAGACQVTASLQIEAVKAAAVGTGLSLPIDGAYVTYLRPQVGSGAAAGFFVQAEATGPAVLVTVDPETLDPVPAVGDQVSFTVTEKGEYGSATEVRAISDWTKGTASFDVSAFVQNLSAATDVITALDDYESELVSFTGTFVANFGSAGSGHVSAKFSTVGFPSGDNQLVLRMPQTLQQEMELGPDCSFTLVAGPMNRYNTNAQPSAYRDTDFAGISCPAPAILAAAATAADRVEITFDRSLDPASVLADGSQFTFDGGLTATAATTNGRTVTVTTGPQTAGTTYTVTVAASVTSRYGDALGTANSATFVGFGLPAAQVIINELNPNISGNKDLIELKVLRGGSTAGLTLYQDLNTLLATLPSVEVATGDFILIHMTPGDDSAPETLSKNEAPQATYAANVDTAWDFHGGNTHITYSGRLIVLKDGNGDIVDGVPFFKPTPPAAFWQNVVDLQAAGQWLPADCNGAPCTSNADVQLISVDWNGCGTSPTGNTVARISAVDTNSAADWANNQAPTWGAENF
jgi:hypothetical protein